MVSLSLSSPSCFKVGRYCFLLLGMVILLTCSEKRSLGTAQSLPPPPSINGTSKIIAGHDAAIANYFYQVGVKKTANANYLCAGTIVDPLYVVSAGHCFPEYSRGGSHVIPLNTINIRYGNDVLSSTSKIDVVQIWIHPQFNFTPSIRYDVAILKLKTPLTFTTKVGPIRITPDDSQMVAGSDLTVSGWGRTDEFEEPVNNLQATTADYMPSRCQVAYTTLYVPSIMICLGCGLGGKRTCGGDSGGPGTVTSDSGGCPVLTAITSWGIGCGRDEYPGVIVRISYFLDWIESVVKKNLRSTRQLKPTTSCQVCGSSTTPVCPDATYYNHTRCQSEITLAQSFKLTLAACASANRRATASLTAPTTLKTGRVYFLRSVAGPGKAIVTVNGVRVNTAMKAPVTVSTPVSSTTGVWNFNYTGCGNSTHRYAALYVSPGTSNAFYQLSDTLK